MSWGPFERGIDPCERKCRLRALYALSLVFCHAQPIVNTLRAAQSDPDFWLDEVAWQFEKVPTIPRRRILATWADMVRSDHGRTRRPPKAS
jgi:hypothetical protein